MCTSTGEHVSHLRHAAADELDRLLDMVVDVENLFICVQKDEDPDTKQIYFFLFKVRLVNILLTNKDDIGCNYNFIFHKTFSFVSAYF
jgi:histone acetyltransferase